MAEYVPIDFVDQPNPLNGAPGDPKFNAANLAHVQSQYAEVLDDVENGTGPIGTALNAAYLEHSHIAGSPGVGNVTAGGHKVTLTDGSFHDAFPGLAQLSDGRLAVAYRHATHHEPYGSGSPSSPPTAKGVLHFQRSSDLGRTWSEAVVAFEDATNDARDPALTVLSDGRLVIQFFQHDGLVQMGTFVIISSNDGDSWSAPIEVPFTFTGQCASSAPLVELDTDEWIVAAYGMDTGGTYRSARTIRTTDGGETWEDEATIANGPTASKSFVEPYLGKLADGSLMALIRMDTGTNKEIWRATSADAGKTWSTAVRVIEGFGRPAWVRLTSGGIVLLFRGNGNSGSRPALMATSWDSGATWSMSDVIETSGYEMSYAQMVEVSPGLVAMVLGREDTRSSSTITFRYLIDGNGVSPLWDLSTGEPSLEAEMIVLPSTGWNVLNGTPAVTNKGVTPTIAFDKDSSNEQVARIIGVPPSWTNYNVDLVWCGWSAGAGGVFWGYAIAPIVAGAPLGNGTGLGFAVEADGENVLVTRLATAVTNTKVPAMLRIRRIGSDVTDTYGADAALIAVVLTPTR